MANLLLVLCASALFVQAISCACLGNGIGAAGISNIGLSGCSNGLSYGNSLPAASCGNAGLGLAGLPSPVSGGGLTVSSASLLAPSGLGVNSQNIIGGTVSIKGAMPFLTAVTLEGQMPSVGSAGVQYSCGNGNIGIVNSYGSGSGYSAGLGYGSGLEYGTDLSLGSCGCNGGY